MKLSEFIVLLNARSAGLDLEAVLWDMDTGSYFAIESSSVELQRMADGRLRISIGPVNYTRPNLEDPAERPVGSP